MSNSILMDLFDKGDFNEIMIMFHHSLIHDNPLLANSVAQFVLRHTEEPDPNIGEEELSIIKHLTQQLIKADEVRFQKKKPPLAQEYDQLISKRMH